MGFAGVAVDSGWATLEGIASAPRMWGRVPSGGRRFPWQAWALHLFGLPSRFPPGIFRVTTGVPARVWSRGLHSAMLLPSPKRLRVNSQGSLRARRLRLPGICWFSFLLHTSLPASHRLFFRLSKLWRAGLTTGLRRLGPFSATKILAYLPCRLGTDGSTFHFNSGGGALKKASGPRPFPKLLCRHYLISSFSPNFHPVVLGVLTCPIRIVARLKDYCPPVLVSFSPRQLLRPAGPSVVRGRERGRPPSHARLCVARQERCAGIPPRPDVPTRRVFSQLSLAHTASAPITAARPLNPVGSSRCNHRHCFLTRPDSACRTVSPTMGACKIGIGWRPNA